MENEKPISFQGTTNGGTESTEVHEFDESGVITGVLVGTEVGQEYALENYAEVISDGAPTSLWDHVDREFLAGNGRDYDLRIRYEFDEGDRLKLKAVNDDPNHQYHHTIIVRVDYDDSPLETLRGAYRRFA